MTADVDVAAAFRPERLHELSTEQFGRLVVSVANHPGREAAALVLTVVALDVVGDTLRAATRRSE